MNEILRILLIDDNPDDRLLTIRALRREFPDLQVQQITEAEGFAQALEAGDLDLAITDYQLRWSDGLAVLRAVKARYPDCPVIMFTATGSEEIAVEAMKNGLDDYVLKSPKHFIRLPAAVRSALKRAEDGIERKRAEEALRRERDNLVNIFEAMEDGVYIVNQQYDIQYVNPVLVKDFGPYHGCKCYEYFHDREEVCPWCKNQDVFAGKTVRWEWYSFKNERTYDLIDTLLTNPDGSISKLEIFRDITERKRAEEELRESEERYHSLFNGVPVGINRTTPGGQTIDANPALVHMLGYPDRETLLAVNVTDLYVDPEDRRRWQALVEREGVVRGSEVQLRRRDGTTIWVRSNTRSVCDSSGRVLHYEGSLEDITERKRAEEELQRTLEKLREALGGIIQTVVLTVEMRDPYTAGHQRRVANLARAIATEMGLSEDQIEGIRMAGGIHDLGKVGVPAEILGRPGQLSDLQFGLIKMHSQIGYDVLKTVEFPWPVAQIVLQHHERLDGSGYPQGLSGEDILLEARILAVADVVEAMASRRPYRPPRGLDKALEEISQNRGVLYDPEAVDACLKLFTENGFAFE